jgi:hypothetical protein
MPLDRGTDLSLANGRVVIAQIWTAETSGREASFVHGTRRDRLR